MALNPGVRLGPYEVVGALGAGGMGEVYKARDRRLDRTVALKVLPSDVAGDADSRARFEREARAIAALDHPHICGIYDVGSVEGTHYLVMPHLEGQTLAARLEKGPVPLDQALKIGVEISDALDKAHRQGIVHRDIKPANIMLTKAGSKLLDFGLAKLRSKPGPISVSGMTRMATVVPETAHGAILGTVQYMAPEQLEGREADARSDIWALGALLHEMLTGVRPFAGDTPASVIGAILRDTPPAISTRQPLAPRALDHLVNRCLAKDPDERWQSIGDIGAILERIAARPAADATPSVRLGRRERVAWMAATTLLLIGLALVGVWTGPVAAPADTVRLSINLPESAAFSPHMGATVSIPQFALSPDGRTLVFVAAKPLLKPTLWLRPLESAEARPMAGTEDAQDPFWSPDGRWVGFFDAQGTLKRVALAGGTVHTIARNISDPRGASWGPDDTILIGTGYGPVYRVAAGAGGATPQPVTQLDAARSEGSHRWPQFLPDGRRFLFTARSGLADHRAVYVGGLNEQTRHLVLRLDSDAQYVSTGYLLFLDGDSLLAQRFDGDRLVLSGQPTPIEAHVGRSSRGNGAFSASATGTIAYAGAILQPGRLTWFDRTGTELGIVGPDREDDFADFRLSPDEKRLAASLVDPKLSLPDIWMFDLARGGATRFTFGPAVNAAAVWEPQSGRIVFRTNRKGLTELYEKSVVGGGNDEPLVTEEFARKSGVAASNLMPTDWSSDGRRLLFSTGVPSDIWLLTLADPGNPVRIGPIPGDQMHANFSPDVGSAEEGLVAYTSSESDRFEVFARSLGPTKQQWPVSVNGGYEPRWRADGRELYYLAEDRTLMAVSVSSGPITFGEPRPLFRAEVHPGVSLLRTHYVPSRDGKRFLIHRRTYDVTPPTIMVVLNGLTARKP